MKYVLAIVLLIFASAAQAKYFIWITDDGITDCLYTSVEKEPELRKKIEDSWGMNCSSVVDNEGSIIMTCKGFATHMYVYEDTKAKCESLKKSFATMLNN